MALALNLTIAGQVGNDIVRLLINGTEVPLTGRTYQATIPVTSSLVALTTISNTGVELVRSLQVNAVAGGAG